MLKDLGVIIVSHKITFSLLDSNSVEVICTAATALERIEVKVSCKSDVVKYNVKYNRGAFKFAAKTNKDDYGIVNVASKFLEAKEYEKLEEVLKETLNCFR